MFRPRRLGLVFICLGFGFSACVNDSGGGSGGGWEAAIDTVGDTVIVRTLSGSAWGDTAYLEEEVSIGMLEGPDEYLIGNPRSIAVAGGGEIYVLDRQVPVIRMYGPDGSFIRNVGHEGGGPGEYKSPGAIAVLPDNRLIVRDPGNGRVSIYSTEGEYSDQVWYPGGFNTGRRLYTDTAGFAYSMVLLNYGTAPWDWIFGLTRIDPSAGILDTIAA
ncbi:6-bladed beta-propeller, partial [Gemmatimonadota bacterium]